MLVRVVSLLVLFAALALLYHSALLRSIRGKQHLHGVYQRAARIAWAKDAASPRAAGHVLQKPRRALHDLDTDAAAREAGLQMSAQGLRKRAGARLIYSHCIDCVDLRHSENSAHLAVAGSLVPCLHPYLLEEHHLRIVARCRLSGSGVRHDPSRRCEYFCPLCALGDCLRACRHRRFARHACPSLVASQYLVRRMVRLEVDLPIGDVLGEWRVSAVRE